LFGIAIQKGYIQNEDVPISDFFNEIEDSKKEITIRNLLQMSSGLSWPGNGAMIPTKNWIKFILEQPIVTEPGSHMTYSCGNSHLLSMILHKVTGIKTVDFARKNLLTPMGIHDFSWHQDSQGITIGGFGMSMNIEDMVKLGLLYLRKGQWASKQLIPSDWIDKTIISSKASPSYGYHWWVMDGDSERLEEEKTYYAMGMAGDRGQYIFVDQKKRLVCVFTSKLSSSSPTPIQYYQKYIY